MRTLEFTRSEKRADPPVWMDRHVIAFLVAVTLPGLEAGADWSADRFGSDPSSRLIFWQVQRLYPGRQGTNTCSGMREECIRSDGEPSERHEGPGGEKHLIYRGRKTLYRGSGESNRAVGREWREYVVRSGEVVEAFDVVQMIEHRYPWDSTMETWCEPYGDRDFRDCDHVTSLDLVLPEAKARRPPFDFGCPPGAKGPPLGTRMAKPIDPARLSRFVENDLYRQLGHEQLSMYTPAPDPDDEGDLFLGQSSSRTLERDEGRIVSCARVAHLALQSQSNWAGAIGVGLCDRTTELTWDTVCDARVRLTRTALLLGLDPKDRRDDFRWSPPHHQRLRGGLESEYLSVLVVGHGVNILPTLIVTSLAARDAVFVQANLDSFCDWNKQSPLCTDTETVLTALGRRVAERFLPGP